jgi:hypothetical protein
MTAMERGARLFTASLACFSPGAALARACACDKATLSPKSRADAGCTLGCERARAKDVGYFRLAHPINRWNTSSCRLKNLPPYRSRERPFQSPERIKISNIFHGYGAARGVGGADGRRRRRWHPCKNLRLFMARFPRVVTFFSTLSDTDNSFVRASVLYRRCGLRFLYCTLSRASNVV